MTKKLVCFAFFPTTSLVKHCPGVKFNEKDLSMQLEVGPNGILRFFLFCVIFLQL